MRLWGGRGCMSDETFLAGLRDSRTGAGRRENFGTRTAVSAEEANERACRLAEMWLDRRRSGIEDVVHVEEDTTMAGVNAEQSEDLVDPEPEERPYDVDEPEQVLGGGPFEGRRFRHPETGNQVLFQSLPVREQQKLMQQVSQRGQPQRGPSEDDRSWMPEDMRRQQGEHDERVRRQREQSRRVQDEHVRKMMEETGESREDVERSMRRQPTHSGLPSDDDPYRGRFAEDGETLAELGRGIFGGEMDGWTFLPEREATGDAEAAHMLTIPAVVHGRPGGKPGDPEGEPPPPAEVRRMLAERMRDMGRGLMVAGAKPPRQQMVEIGRVIDGLLDQLELLADQPGRVALRRRILLNLRGRALGR